MSTIGFTYNVIVKRFEDFCNQHALIQNFTHGQFPSDADIEKNGRYPWMHIAPSSMGIDEGQIIYSIDVVIADLPADKTDKNGHQKEIISDCFLIFQDLVSTIENGTLFGDNVLTNMPINCTPFMEEMSHSLSGVEGSIDLIIDFDTNYCLVPLISNDTIELYSQIIDFETTPMNSIVFRYQGNYAHACYGTNQTDIINFVEMVNSNPPVQNNACFLQYGTYTATNDGRVRCTMPILAANILSDNGNFEELSIEVIYD
jgi:hypothetical protein